MVARKISAWATAHAPAMRSSRTPSRGDGADPGAHRDHLDEVDKLPPPTSNRRVWTIWRGSLYPCESRGGRLQASRTRFSLRVLSTGRRPVAIGEHVFRGRAFGSTVSSPAPKREQPVGILVGDLHPATAISADGPRNILNAIRTAVSPDAGGKGVLTIEYWDIDRKPYPRKSAMPPSLSRKLVRSRRFTFQRSVGHRHVSRNTRQGVER
jgi:hypothetical protein